VNVEGRHHRTVWLEGSDLCLIDQRLLPYRFEVLRAADHRATAEAIADMTVRGAGAIGAAGGFGMAQGVLEAPEDAFEAYVADAAARLRATRPTAQNLFYAIDRVLAAITPPASVGDFAGARVAAVQEAQHIADQDAEACRRIGEHGAMLVPDGARVSTHCNAGWLAFVDWGSALSPVYAAIRQGKAVFVWVDETRPRSQGSKLTAWELVQEGVPHRVLCDGASASYMARGEVDMVIVGSDRIAANGDVANKIGTYPAALAAREAGIPFYVAAPTSTIDPDCPSGDAIPIEERDPDEVLYVWGRDDDGRLTRVRIAPAPSGARNPAFDVTPAKLVRGIITEFGVVSATPEGIARALSARDAAWHRR
jgi:methylthioribose-1-phosphate isomerase